MTVKRKIMIGILMVIIGGVLSGFRLTYGSGWINFLIKAVGIALAFQGSYLIVFSRKKNQNNQRS